jgi:hypothetical protein
MKPNINVVIACVTALLLGAGFAFGLQSFERTMLLAADRMSPKLSPTEHEVTVQGTMAIGNRKGSNLDVGVTIGK